MMNDLEAINRVIEAAIMTWSLPERVKRLTLPGYRYHALDLEHFVIIVAEQNNTVVAVAAWDTEPLQALTNKNGLLLHGIYVHPDHQHKGIGGQLFKAAEDAARTQALEGVLVKAQKDAEGFFVSQGLEKLEARDANRDYAGRYWKAVR